jgi:hypothetical protein
MRGVAGSSAIDWLNARHFVIGMFSAEMGNVS